MVYVAEHGVRKARLGPAGGLTVYKMATQTQTSACEVQRTFAISPFTWR